MFSGLLIALLLTAPGPAPLAAAREGHVQAQVALQQAHAEVAAQQQRLDALSAEIASEKAKQGQPALFGNRGLEAKLAQSQALAEALAQARSRESARAVEVESAREALYRALSTEISGRAAEARDPAALAEVQKLEAERAGVAPHASGAVASPSFAGTSDDPRELRERADALRDQADKLARQEAALDTRIQAARQQAQLERQLRRLSGADALFDESDRRLRVTRVEQPAPSSGVTSAAPGPGPASRQPGANPALSSSSRATSAATDAASAVGPSMSMSAGGGVGGNNALAPSAQPTPTASTDAPSPAISAPAALVPTVRQGEVVRPEELAKGGVSLDGDGESLEALLKSKSRLASERARLESQARALESQAAGK